MTENTIHETADAIRSLFIEIQYCLKMRDALDNEEPSGTRQYMKEMLVKRQRELEQRLEELTGLQIGDFDFHVG